MFVWTQKGIFFKRSIQKTINFFFFFCSSIFSSTKQSIEANHKNNKRKNIKRNLPEAIVDKIKCLNIQITKIWAYFLIYIVGSWWKRKTLSLKPETRWERKGCDLNPVKMPGWLIIARITGLGLAPGYTRSMSKIWQKYCFISQLYMNFFFFY